jgi:hypothetical protein
VCSIGSTACSVGGGAAAVQIVDITDTDLPAGQYWMAMSGSSTGLLPARYAPSIGRVLDIAGVYQQDTHPLPATATVISTGLTSGFIPGFALHFTATV